MFKKFLLIFLIVFSFAPEVFAQTKSSKDVVWNSAEGLKMLERSQFKNDFYQLVNFYQPQENPLFCSIATGTMIRNALNYGNIPSQKTGEIIKPDGQVAEYHLYSQKDFFNAKTEKIKKRAIVEYKEPMAGGENFDAGLSLDNFAQMLKSHGLKVATNHVKKNDEKFAKKFRKALKKNLAEEKNFIAANFDGKILGKTTRGHISPIVAYDEVSDSILVLDAALHKNQWYWAEVSKMLEAMNSKDGETYRGYLVVGQ